MTAVIELDREKGFLIKTNNVVLLINSVSS